MWNLMFENEFCARVSLIRSHVRQLQRSSDLTKDQDVNLYENASDKSKSSLL